MLKNICSAMSGKSMERIKYTKVIMSFVGVLKVDFDAHNVENVNFAINIGDDN